MGLATHPKVKEAAIKAVDNMVFLFVLRFLNGTSKMHLELEEKLAAHVEKEAALYTRPVPKQNLVLYLH